MEQLEKLLEDLGDYSTRNEYGMSYDNYYHIYDEDLNIPYRADTLLDEIQNILHREKKLERILK